MKDTSLAVTIMATSHTGMGVRTSSSVPLGAPHRPRERSGHIQLNPGLSKGPLSNVQYLLTISHNPSVNRPLHEMTVLARGVGASTHTRISTLETNISSTVHLHLIHLVPGAQHTKAQCPGACLRRGPPPPAFRSPVIQSQEITPIDHIPTHHHPAVSQTRASTTGNSPNKGPPIIRSMIIQTPLPAGQKGAGIAHHQQTSLCLTVSSTSSLHHRGTPAPPAAQPPQYLNPDPTQHSMAGKRRTALENTVTARWAVQPMNWTTISLWVGTENDQADPNTLAVNEVLSNHTTVLRVESEIVPNGGTQRLG